MDFAFAFDHNYAAKQEVAPECLKFRALCPCTNSKVGTTEQVTSCLEQTAEDIN